MTKKKILIVGPAWIGDMVMAQSLFKVLHQRGCIIDVVAPPWSFVPLKRMPEVRTAIPLDVPRGKLQLKKRYQLAKELRKESYDQAITLPNSFKSALLPFWAKIPQRTGWRGEMRWGLLNDLRLLDKEKYSRMVERFVALAYDKGEAWDKHKFPYPRLAVDQQSLAKLLEKLELKPQEKPVLALCPGAAFGETKRWPSEYFAELAKKMLAQGWQVWLFGGPGEHAIAEAIQKLSGGGCINLIGRAPLDDTIDLFSVVKTVVANDSGLMHLACAVDCSVVAIYGSTLPDFAPPLSEQAEMLSIDIDCRPCKKRVCPLVHLKCLRDLKPTRVAAAIEALN
ncbi:MAG: lipopolysaccharide heptosyltransferase II [Gammaproteobacteria bacterium]